MASTAQGERLTVEHRRRQALIAQRTLAEMAAAWAVLDAADLRATVQPWLTVVLPVLEARRRESAALGAEYARSFRTAEVGLAAAAVATPGLAGVLPRDRVVPSLLATGPGRMRKLLRAPDADGVGLSLLAERAAQKALVTASGSAVRHVLNGGRSAVFEAVDADPRALGWARATAPGCCFFCGLLASRGHVYRSESTASFQPHDTCKCQPEPTYRRGSSLPPGSREAGDLYARVSRAIEPGQDVRLAFRREWERPGSVLTGR